MTFRSSSFKATGPSDFLRASFRSRRWRSSVGGKKNRLNDRRVKDHASQKKDSPPTGPERAVQDLLTQGPSGSMEEAAVGSMDKPEGRGRFVSFDPDRRAGLVRLLLTACAPPASSPTGRGDFVA
jgi:hypothetical protein